MHSFVIKVSIGYLLLLAATFRSEALATSQTDRPQEVTRKLATSKAASATNQQVADQIAEPTTTSIHQVWTSTSSGSLEELSPEMISKLRGDVPFLAAYATRPRLINGAAISLRPVGSDSFGIGTQMQPPTNLQVGASSEVPIRTSQAQTAPVLSKLGGFNELKIETSSSSKSEHTHKKSTSLKRRAQDEQLSSKNRVTGDASRLVKERRRKLSARKKSSSNQKRLSFNTSGMRSKNLKPRLIKNNLVYPKNMIRNGRYQDGAPSLIGTNDKSATGANRPANDLPSTGASIDGTKGGSVTAGKKPFYKPKDQVEDDEGKADRYNGLVDNSSSSPELPNDVDDEESDENIDDEPASIATPKRVGDGDVDEVDGDTVMVEPKSDGVDDDPELPDEAPTEEPNNDEDDEKEKPDLNQDRGDIEASGKERGTNEENQNGSGGSVAGGGGLGGAVDMSPGVTFAGEDEKSLDDDSSLSIGRNRPEHDRRSGGGSRSEDRGETDDSVNDESETKREGVKDGDHEGPLATGSKEAESKDSNASGSRPTSSGRPKVDQSDDDVELDYRDEVEDDRRTNSTTAQGKRTGADKHPLTPNDCQDDHHHHHHHHHHDTIKWLEEAVPGKPGVDYPTLNTVNTSNFNCRGQKYPGYYADVESRCQVFHICQADGRQDSFL